MRDAPMAVATFLALFSGACDTRALPVAARGASTGAAPGGSLLTAGARCASNQACASGICGIDGIGRCCSAACATEDPSCGASACDDTGICSYPQPGIVCPDSCSGDTLVQSSCDGSGHCESQSSEVCPDHFACADGGCHSSCASSVDCVPDFRCNAGACVPPATLGPCTENDDCLSGACGIDGTGNCCSVRCKTQSAICGATACDGSGACLYPDSATACGSVLQGCTGHTQQEPSLCNGVGDCNDMPGTIDCSPFMCGATACSSICTSNSGCPSGEFCDLGQATCCSGLRANGVMAPAMAVDGVSGSDTTACCGIGGASPCQTLAHALQLVDMAQMPGVTLTATMNAPYGTLASNWATLETYPIVLGWGVVLKAAGIYFPDPRGDGKVFDIKATSPDDPVYGASIVGTPAYPVGIGMSVEGSQSNDLLVIDVAPANTAYLADVSVNGSAANKSTAIHVNAGGSLVLGQDLSGTITGTVTIGNDLNSFASDGYDGIVCGASQGLGCTISDPGMGGFSLVILGQEHRDIDAEDFASISLTSNPSIGLPPPRLGFNTCRSKVDASAGSEAVLLHGAARMTFSGSVQCIAGDAFRLSSSPSGVPELALNGGSIQNSERALRASAGSASVSGAIITFNYIGVEQDGDGSNLATVDLSGDKDSIGLNLIICSSSTESVDAGSDPLPGVCVLNTTSQTLNASNVVWDTSGPDLFTCNASLGDCSCANDSCSASPGADGMDAVSESTGTITLSGNLQHTIDCLHPGQ